MILSISEKHTRHSSTMDCHHGAGNVRCDSSHDDVIKWKHFPRNWPFVREIHRSPVNFPHKGQWRGALMFSLIYAWINDWVNNHEAGDLRRQHGHYDVIVMENWLWKSLSPTWVNLFEHCPIITKCVWFHWYYFELPHAWYHRMFMRAVSPSMSCFVMFCHCYASIHFNHIFQNYFNPEPTLNDMGK